MQTRKILFYTVLAITAIAAVTSFYLASLSKPTDSQKQLSNTSNAILVVGTSALCGLLSNQSKKEDEQNKRGDDS